MAHVHDSTLPIGQLCVVVQRLLVTGYPKIERVAWEVGISRRTLQRRLATAGMSYSSLVNRIRYMLAAKSLEDHSVSISSIATAVGFANHSGFSRAFHRWAGVTPRQYRAEGRTATRAIARPTDSGVKSFVLVRSRAAPFRPLFSQ
jgi:AraC-like DNA-binding protein